MQRPSRLAVGRFGSLIAVLLLVFAIINDLVAVSPFGGLSADAYYEPLQGVALSDAQRKAVEDNLIQTHGRMERQQRRVWLGLHGMALAGALAGCIALLWQPQGQGSGS